MTTSSLTVPARFNGPPGSGNGGWCAGAIASRVAGVGGGAVEVRLRKPPPLDTAMEVGEQDGWTVATRAGEVVLQARPGAEPEPLAPVTVEAARAAAATYDGFADHPFGHCFSCGPERAEGDGLRIFPGRVGAGTVAAPWTPHDDHATHATLEETWAAIDCAGAWAAGIGERAMVLGSMTAQVLGLPAAGVEHVVVGAVRSVEGRRHRTATTLRTADGDLIAAAEQVWFEIDPATFG